MYTYSDCSVPIDKRAGQLVIWVIEYSQCLL